VSPQSPDCLICRFAFIAASYAPANRAPGSVYQPFEALGAGLVADAGRHALKRTYLCPIYRHWPIGPWRAACTDTHQRCLALALLFSRHPDRAQGVLNLTRNSGRRVIAQRPVGAQIESSSLNSFDGFGLNDAIARAVAEEKYVSPTPIQVQTIPIVMSRRDVIGIAQTGTGKTAAFALPILHQLTADPRPPERKSCRVLVLSPTRELSGQILDSFRTYGRHLRVRTALAIGGVPMGGQVRSLMGGVDVLVATPGRLLDLVHNNALRLGSVEFLVLDEADRMLDMGFIHDIRKIVAKLPAKRQTLLFSATMPRAIAELAAQLLHDPIRVAVTPVASTVERVEQRIIHVDRGAKPSVLVDVLRREALDRALIFTRTKHGADKVVRGLIKAGITAQAIHGNKSQGQRERVLAAFRRGDVKTLVATDIAARGIDVDGISHVVNFDLPNVPETYVHRIGRTARAGAEGIAISLCDREELPFLRDIEKLIGQSIPATGERAPSTRHEAPRPHHHAGQRPNRFRAEQRRRHENNAAPAHRPQEQTGESPDGIASVGFLRSGNRSRREGAPRAPHWNTQSKGSRHGKGRAPAV
jgi:ATP-dependent RNA helicase RhlE